jgi:uncharacterized membrane protein YraQ (UPF0718 family)
MTRLVYELRIVRDLIIVQCRQILPYWLIGTLLGSVVSVYASKWISLLAARMENKKYSVIQAFIAAILGVASPVCMYGTIPMIAALGKKNVSQYVLSVFMVSSILLNPNLFIIGFALGTRIALLRLIISIAGGILGGTLVFIFFNGKNFFNFSGFESYADNDKTRTKKNFIKDIGKSMSITAPYLTIGIVLTALFDRYFPPEILDALFLKNKALSVLFMASAGVPVYVCGGGTIPLLKAWLNAGMSVGSAVAFMLSGPATKLTNLGAVKIILGTRNFILYICYSLLFAVLAGLLTDVAYQVIR